MKMNLYCKTPEPRSTAYSPKNELSLFAHVLFSTKNEKNSFLFSPKNNCILFVHGFTFYILETTVLKLIILKKSYNNQIKKIEKYIIINNN